MGPIERACPQCGDPGFVNLNGQRYCNNPACPHVEPFEEGVEMVTIPAADWRGAVETLQHIVESSEHPSLTVRTTDYLGHVARKWLDENGYPTTTGGR